MRSVRWLGGSRRPALLAGLLLLGTPDVASAYCRTTTCDEDTVDCPRDDEGCLTTGDPLFWGTRCLSFGIHERGAPSAGISYEAAVHSMSQAFLTWVAADCGGARPSLEVWDLAGLAGPVTCERPEFNQCAPNANTIVFREDEWPYEGQSNVLAFTNVTYAKQSGQILDADIEINAVTAQLSLTEPAVANDLQSILTHEIGHFLGFDHSKVGGAVMARNMRAGTTELRELGADDVAAVCDTYPPDRDVPDCLAPKVTRGFTRQCVQSADAPEETEDACRVGAAEGGCSCRAAGRRNETAAAAWGLIAATALGSQRRRVRRPRARGSASPPIGQRSTRS